MAEVVALGLDLSLTSTGLAAMVDGRLARVHNIKTKGTNADRYPQYLRRIRGIANEIRWWIEDIGSDFGPVNLAIIEAPSYGSRNGKPHERAGLWWEAYSNMHDAGIDIVALAPTTRAKYITGSGKADKAKVLEEAAWKYGELVTNDDIADAAGMAAMASRALGLPVIDELPTLKCLEAFEGVPWQTLLPQPSE